MLVKISSIQQLTLHTSHSSKLSLSHASTRISRPKKANTLMIGGSNSPILLSGCRVQGRHRRHGYNLAHQGEKMGVGSASCVSVRVQGAIIRGNEAGPHRGRGRSEASAIRFTLIEQVEAPPSTAVWSTPSRKQKWSIFLLSSYCFVS